MLYFAVTVAVTGMLYAPFEGTMTVTGKLYVPF